MVQRLGAVALLVRDYDIAIGFFRNVLGFDLVEDTPVDEVKRWVRMTPPGSSGAGLVLARADDDAQRAVVGGQGGGRVLLFLETDDFDRDHTTYLERGVRFVEPPRHEPYGTVAVFEDCEGNRWDLIQPGTPTTSQTRRLISSGSTFENDIGYSRAVVDGDWVHVAGTTGFDYATMTIAEAVEDQVEQCLDNVEAALRDGGCTFADVVRVRYLLAHGSDFEPCWPALRQRFGSSRPAATMMQCGLSDPRMRIEIEVTARRSR